MPHADPAVRAAYHRDYAKRYRASPENMEKVRASERARTERIKEHIDAMKLQRGLR